MDISLYRMIPPEAQQSVFVNTIALMNVISHQLEDVVIANDLRLDFYTGFQRFSYFARQEQRYRRLAQVCRRVFVWGVPDIVPPVIPGVEYIPLAPLAASSAVVRDSGGQVAGWLVSLHTTGAAHRFARQQRGTLTPLAPRLQRQLTVLQQLVRMLPGLSTQPDLQQRMIDQMSRTIDELHRTMQRLALLQQIEEQETPHRQPMLLSQLFQQARDEAQPQADQLHVAIQLDLVADLPPCWCEPEQLQLALCELLANAIRATSQGGTVQLSAQRHSQQLVLRVADRGSGVAPADLPLLTEPFYQQQSDDQQLSSAGTGLGLALARAVTYTHQGNLTIESTPDVGTTVTICLPLHA